MWRTMRKGESISRIGSYKSECLLSDKSDKSDKSDRMERREKHIVQIVYL